MSEPCISHLWCFLLAVAAFNTVWCFYPPPCSQLVWCVHITVRGRIDGRRWETGGQTVLSFQAEWGEGWGLQSVEEDVLKCCVCACWKWRRCGQIRWTAGLHLLVPTDSHHQRNIACRSLWRWWQSDSFRHASAAASSGEAIFSVTCCLKWGELTLSVLDLPGKLQGELWICIGMTTINTCFWALAYIHSRDGK